MYHTSSSLLQLECIALQHQHLRVVASDFCSILNYAKCPKRLFRDFEAREGSPLLPMSTVYEVYRHRRFTAAILLISFSVAVFF